MKKFIREIGREAGRARQLFARLKKGFTALTCASSGKRRPSIKKSARDKTICKSELRPRRAVLRAVYDAQIMPNASREKCRKRQELERKRARFIRANTLTLYCETEKWPVA
ncbi:MAG TPA: hypothetical protein VGC91_07600 [Pyrinomonadaceae bacterium]|jgi:hypothetical protein